MSQNNLENLKIKSIDWIENTLVSRNYPPSYSHNIRKQHGGIKPPELMFELINAYGRKSRQIIDPFAGVGSSLIATSLLKKNAVGIEINPDWRFIYNRVCKENTIKLQTWITGDSQKELQTFEDNYFDFLITDVPYFSMDKLKQTRGRFSKAGENTKGKLKTSLKVFNDKPIPTIKEWKLLIKNIFNQSYNKLKDNSFIVIFIGNMYRNLTVPHSKKTRTVGKYLLLSNEVAEILESLNYQLVNELIWMDTSKKLGVYGYPYTWIPSLVDQRILIFKK